jgi:hypothetical protein
MEICSIIELLRNVAQIIQFKGFISLAVSYILQSSKSSRKEGYMR